MLEITPLPQTKFAQTCFSSFFLETESQKSDVVVQLKDFSHTSVLRMTNERKKEMVTDVPKWRTKPLF